MQAPKARRIPKTLDIHGDLREDPYYWLNQREDQEVIDYLNQENAYTQNKMKPTEELQGETFPGDHGKDQGG